MSETKIKLQLSFLWCNGYRAINLGSNSIGLGFHVNSKLIRNFLKNELIYFELMSKEVRIGIEISPNPPHPISIHSSI